mmetsp:Transcript_95944/g.275454  ORF Transcript_95944/g.275454 Transcript_95944/m.275454 type:complete len:265 (+) Transcript_95944:140-934(+)
MPTAAAADSRHPGGPSLPDAVGDRHWQGRGYRHVRVGGCVRAAPRLLFFHLRILCADFAECLPEVSLVIRVLAADCENIFGWEGQHGQRLPRRGDGPEVQRVGQRHLHVRRSDGRGVRGDFVWRRWCVGGWMALLVRAGLLAVALLGSSLALAPGAHPFLERQGFQERGAPTGGPTALELVPPLVGGVAQRASAAAVVGDGISQACRSLSFREPRQWLRLHAVRRAEGEALAGHAWALAGCSVCCRRQFGPRGSGRVPAAGAVE